jgi:hypothetical protein
MAEQSKGKATAKGLFLTVTFFVVLTLMFMPLIDGKNTLEYLDNLFNTISKGSTSSYIPKQMATAEKLMGKMVDMNFKFTDGEREEHKGFFAKGAETAANAAKLLAPLTDKVEVSAEVVKTSLDLGKMIKAAMVDSQAMFDGKPEQISARYAGMDAKMVMFTWWKVLNNAARQFKLAGSAANEKATSDALKRGVELGYNYAGITPKKVSEEIVVLSTCLVFYVIYTLWWGMAIMYLFEGFGLQMKKGKKKEM